MHLKMKFIIYFLIIASEIDYLWSRPIDLNPSRKKRQVVQPKWLLERERLFGDSDVKVTNENLKEAAAIRAAIQKAVNSDTFAVNVDQPNAPIPTRERSQPARQMPNFPNFPTREHSQPARQMPNFPNFPKFEVPDFEWPELNLSQFNLAELGFPEVSLSEFDPSEFFEPEERAAIVQRMNNWWRQFWGGWRKILKNPDIQ